MCSANEAGSTASSLLQAERERGHVHTAYFKDAMNNQFYPICSCCGGLEAMK